APAPAALQDRRVEITGPTDRKMTINALNPNEGPLQPYVGVARQPRSLALAAANSSSLSTPD
ncbi:hypothetical protein ACWEJS_26380, partial [Rhodococcus triatomae]